MRLKCGLASLNAIKYSFLAHLVLPQRTTDNLDTHNDRLENGTTAPPMTGIVSCLQLKDPSTYGRS
jgi:hypothetical protein